MEGTGDAENVSCFRLKTNLDAGKRCGFVFSDVQDGIKADHFQQHKHLFARREEGALAPGPLHCSEGPDQGPDARAIEISDAREVHRQVRCTGIQEVLDSNAQGFFGFTESQWPIEIEDYRRPGLANTDVQVCLPASRKIN
jgi:hypothetical protein